MPELSKHVIKEIIADQKNEKDASIIYGKIAARIKNPKNRDIVSKIAADEKKHYEILRKYSGVDVKPSRFKIFLYLFCARILGLTFTFKMLENGEADAHVGYGRIAEELPELKSIIDDEERHERELIDLLNEKRLDYMGSIVLGLNDALVELTGALAGYTFAIQDSRNIALLGLITGISASLSMGASEYLSKREEKEDRAFSSSIYTGIAYIVTVMLLVLPFLLFSNPFVNLTLTVLVAVLIIFFFNFYISVARDLNFKQRFFEMAGISVGVAIISFLIGWAVRTFLGFEL
ncbi:MAG: VIT1/CCC1 transporter family protein [Spirochaetales bacterium]|uniref:VIT1/CCC1 transporter family protein n=1 Tax=Candidatus Thalassospirochaeta sargassi TaxID=3119039 RepID=A0AAJ1II60_9SPIO|nr:VIT1/CCC1 transporter family protein [Spirochaetales bacterium]